MKQITLLACDILFDNYKAPWHASPDVPVTFFSGGTLSLNTGVGAFEGCFLSLFVRVMECCLLIS